MNFHISYIARVITGLEGRGEMIGCEMIGCEMIGYKMGSDGV